MDAGLHSEDSGQVTGHPMAGGGLASVSGLPADVVDRCAKAWITSAEQFVGTCATTEGRESMRRLTGLDEEAFGKTLQLVAATLPAEVVMALSKAEPPRPMGALVPDEFLRKRAEAAGGEINPKSD